MLKLDDLFIHDYLVRGTAALLRIKVSYPETRIPCVLRMGNVKQRQPQADDYRG